MSESLTYAVIAKAAAVISCIKRAHDYGDRVEVVVVEKLTIDNETFHRDPANNLPTNYYIDGSMIVNLSEKAIGGYDFDEETSSISFQGSFGGKRDTYYIPLGSIAGVRINGQVAYVCDHFFIVDTEKLDKPDDKSDAIDEAIKESGADVINIFKAPSGMN